MKRLQLLFTPIRIGPMEVKNRLVMAPMSTNLSSETGHVTPALVDFFAARARGGVGLILTGDVTVDGKARYNRRGLGLYDNESIRPWKDLTEAIHADGCRIAPQLVHPSFNARLAFSGVQAVAASPIASRRTRELPRELRLEEIGRIVRQFGDAACRAREADCDAVQIHCAHCHHLLASFLSPLYNKRTDAYGGDIHGRLRLVLEVVRHIRERVGSDFPILMRISGAEIEPGGRTIEETQYIAPILEEAGVDALQISAGTTNLPWVVEPPTGSPAAVNAALSAAIKEVVRIPVISVGRIIHPWVAEAVLKNGKADMVAMGRALLADPDFPRKAADGRWDEIAPCVGDLHCLMSLYGDRTISCLVNSTAGRESAGSLVAAKEPKKILVAGGGPGGLEAARVAALRGHQVTLMEKSSSLGGQFLTASFPPTKQEFTCLIQYLVNQVNRAGVKMELNREVTPEVVAEFGPDAMVVATGGLPIASEEIPGIKQSHVISSWDVLRGRVMPGLNVLVIGGGTTGCEAADFMAHPVDDSNPKGTRVTLLEMLDHVMLDDLSPRRSLLIQRLQTKGVRIITGARVTKILKDGVAYLQQGKEESLRGIDTIVLAMGTRPNTALKEKLEGGSIPIFVVGDAKAPRKAADAIAEGSEVGRLV